MCAAVRFRAAAYSAKSNRRGWGRFRRGGRNDGGPVPVRARRASRCALGRCRRLFWRQTMLRQRMLCCPRRPLLRPRHCVLIVRLVPSSGPGRGIRRSAVRVHRGGSSARLPCKSCPIGRSHGDPSPKWPIRCVRTCAGHRGQHCGGSSRRKRRTSSNSSSLRRRLRLLKLRWRRQRAASVLRGECAELPGAVVEHAVTERRNPGRSSRRAGGARLPELVAVARHGGKRRRRSGNRHCSRNARCEGSLPARVSTDASSAVASGRASSTAVSNDRRWRRCLHGSGGERRRGADDQLSGNWGRSRAVRACQGETLASCLLLRTVYSCSTARSPFSSRAQGTSPSSSGNRPVFPREEEFGPQSTSRRFYARTLMNAGIPVWESSAEGTFGPVSRASAVDRIMTKPTLRLRALPWMPPLP